MIIPHCWLVRGKSWENPAVHKAFVFFAIFEVKNHHISLPHLYNTASFGGSTGGARQHVGPARNVPAPPRRVASESIRDGGNQALASGRLTRSAWRHEDTEVLRVDAPPFMGTVPHFLPASVHPLKPKPLMAQMPPPADTDDTDCTTPSGDIPRSVYIRGGEAVSVDICG